MTRDSALTELMKCKKELEEKYGILRLGVFGSVARNEADDKSDIDVVVQLDTPDLFTIAGIKYDLEDRLHKQVDVVTYNSGMNKVLKNRIDKEALYV